MKICTCLNCGESFEDINPSNESIDYPEDVGMGCIDRDDEGYPCCPNCRTDEHLVDNKIQ